MKSDSKVLAMLQGQIDALKQNKQDVEQHLERTEAWADYLGQWRCHVQNVEWLEEEDVLKATLIIHVPLGQNVKQRPPSWVCLRNVQEFHNLNRELMPFVSWLKNMSLPSASGTQSNQNSLMNFATRTSSSNSLQSRTEKARTVLQKYIDAVLVDDRLNQSEVLYSFLSPSPAYLKNHLKCEEHKFNFPNPFKDKESKNIKNSHESRLKWLETNSSLKTSEDHDVLGEFDTKDFGGTTGDGVAEHFYSLIGEVFDLRGVFKILRKSLMTFVQITYGSTINKQIKDSVAWLTSDLMTARWLKSLRTSLWSETEEITEDPFTSLPDEVIKDKAQHALLRHIPDWLATMVGQQSSKVGILKVFDALQEKMLNKLLLYDLLEIVMSNLFPELVRSYAFQQFRTMSV